MIHLLNLKELHLDHISALRHDGISSGSIKLAPSPSNETFRYYVRGRKYCLRNVKFQLSLKYLGNLTDERLPHLFYEKKFNLRVFKYHTEPMYQNIGYPGNERALSLLYLKIQVLEVPQYPRCSRLPSIGLTALFPRWDKFGAIRLVQVVSLEFEYSQTRLPLQSMYWAIM